MPDFDIEVKLANHAEVIYRAQQILKENNLSGTAVDTSQDRIKVRKGVWDMAFALATYELEEEKMDLENLQQEDAPPK